MAKIISRTAEIMKKYEELGLVRKLTYEEVQGALERSNNHKKESRKPKQEILPDCPICKKDEVKHHVKRESNGICGPGYSSWIVEEYFICKLCGIHFSKLDNEGK